RRLRFVGDPDQRIAEDYLRILRVFRVHAWYGHKGGADPAALAACARHAAGLARVSRERIGTEVRKLLSAPGPVEAVALVQAAGVLAQPLAGAAAGGLAALAAVPDGAAGPGAVCPRSPEDTAMMRKDWALRAAAPGADDAAGGGRLSRAAA